MAADNSLSFHFELLRPETTGVGRVICLATRDNTFHVEALFRGSFFSAHFDTGVRFTDALPNQGDPEFWDIIEVPEQVTDEIAAWATSRVGRSYDFFGALNSCLRLYDKDLPAVHDENKDFCSMCAREIGQQVGIPLDILPPPSLLRSQLKLHVGLQSVVMPAAKFEDQDVQCISGLVDYGKIDQGFSEKLIAACSR